MHPEPALDFRACTPCKAAERNQAAITAWVMIGDPRRKAATLVKNQLGIGGRDVWSQGVCSDVTKNYYCHYRISQWEDMGPSLVQGPSKRMAVFHKTSVGDFLLVQWLSEISTWLRLGSSEAKQRFMWNCILISSPNKLMLAMFENHNLSEFAMDHRVVASFVTFEWSNPEKQSIWT